MTVKEFKEKFKNAKEIRFYMCGGKDVTNHPEIDEMMVIGAEHHPDGTINVDVIDMIFRELNRKKRRNRHDRKKSVGNCK